MFKLDRTNRIMKKEIYIKVDKELVDYIRV